MMRKRRSSVLLAAILCLLLGIPALGGTRWVFPSETDGAITEYDYRQLVIFEPGVAGLSLGVDGSDRLVVDGGQ